MSKVIKFAYRSWKLLHEAPQKSRLQMEKLLSKHLNKKGRGCKGRYALLLAGMSMFTHRAFQIFSDHVSESESHHAVLERNVVWSNYEQVSAPDVKYEHNIIISATGVWRCEVGSTKKPCWQHRIRGTSRPSVTPQCHNLDANTCVQVCFAHTCVLSPSQRFAVVVRST